MGNDNWFRVIGKEDVCLMIEKKMRLIFRDGKHISDMRLSLISIRGLNDEGFCNIFSYGKSKFTKGSLVVAKGLKHSKLYVARKAF